MSQGPSVVRGLPGSLVAGASGANPVVDNDQRGGNGPRQQREVQGGTCHAILAEWHTSSHQLARWASKLRRPACLRDSRPDRRLWHSRRGRGICRFDATDRRRPYLFDGPQGTVRRTPRSLSLIWSRWHEAEPLASGTSTASAIEHDDLPHRPTADAFSADSNSAFPAKPPQPSWRIRARI